MLPPVWNSVSAGEQSWDFVSEIIWCWPEPQCPSSLMIKEVHRRGKGWVRVLLGWTRPFWIKRKGETAWWKKWYFSMVASGWFFWQPSPLLNYNIVIGAPQESSHLCKLRFWLKNKWQKMLLSLHLGNVKRFRSCARNWWRRPSIYIISQYHSIIWELFFFFSGCLFSYSGTMITGKNDICKFVQTSHAVVNQSWLSMLRRETYCPSQNQSSGGSHLCVALSEALYPQTRSR